MLLAAIQLSYANHDLQTLDTQLRELLEEHDAGQSNYLLFSYALYRLKMGDFELAKPAFDLLVKRQPQQPKVLCYAAILHERLGNLGTALSYLSTAMQQPTHYPVASLIKARILLRQHNEQAARQLCLHALDQSPHYWPLQALLFNVLKQQGDEVEYRNQIAKGHERFEHHPAMMQQTLIASDFAADLIEQALQKHADNVAIHLDI